jgi:hypothetical protein
MNLGIIQEKIQLHLARLKNEDTLAEGDTRSGRPNTLEGRIREIFRAKVCDAPEKLVRLTN